MFTLRALTFSVGAVCVGEMTVMLSCLKNNDFDEAPCTQLIDAFKTCVQVAEVFIILTLFCKTSSGQACKKQRTQKKWGFRTRRRGNEAVTCITSNQIASAIPGTKVDESDSANESISSLHALLYHHFYRNVFSA
ncbi:hypothetical protein CLF_109510, partial [Clonorchis sinensis]